MPYASSQCACTSEEYVDVCFSSTVVRRFYVSQPLCVRLRVEMVCGQTNSFSTREKSSTARSLMGMTTSKTTHFTGAAHCCIVRTGFAIVSTALLARLLCMLCSW